MARDESKKAEESLPGMKSLSGSAVGTKSKSKPRKAKPRQIPRYHVVLWNDNHHTYDYVIAMMQKLFGHPTTRGKLIAKEVDTRGKAICLTTTLEHAELKRDQIHGFGPDPLIKQCQGAMWATIEPAE